MADSILKKNTNNTSNLSSKRELLLILFLGVVFGFLILSMIFSYYLTFFKHEESIRNLTYFSTIENSLSTFQMNIIQYSQEAGVQSKKKAAVAITDLNSAVDNLDYSIHNLTEYSETKFEETLLEQIRILVSNSEKIIIEGQRILANDADAAEYLIYSKKWKLI
ncbi:MAG: hypothetical protein U5K00_00195 [Melioribacteraceae bacterium]|nr:hypothetical protein [Melioribacteraceae bacterium]